jgi:hypothetical protein
MRKLVRRIISVFVGLAVVVVGLTSFIPSGAANLLVHCGAVSDHAAAWAPGLESLDDWLVETVPDHTAVDFAQCGHCGCTAACGQLFGMLTNASGLVLRASVTLHSSTARSPLNRSQAPPRRPPRSKAV